MPTKLQLKFDASQEHQVRAVESIVGLFEGFARYEAAFQLGDEIVANLPPYEDLAELWLLGNLQAIQRNNANGTLPHTHHVIRNIALYGPLVQVSVAHYLLST